MIGASLVVITPDGSGYLTYVLLSYFDFGDLVDRLLLERRRAGAVHLVQELSYYHI